MIGTDVVVGGTALLTAVVAGLVAHELAHAAVLRLFGIDHTVTYFPSRTGGIAGLLLSCPWAVVRPRPTGREAPIHLRAAALAPVVLAGPVFGAGLLGVASTDSPAVTALAIGWLACSIPSPQDFSVVFYAHRHLETERTPQSTATAPGSRAD